MRQRQVGVPLTHDARYDAARAIAPGDLERQRRLMQTMLLDVAINGTAAVFARPVQPRKPTRRELAARQKAIRRRQRTLEPA